MQFLWNWALPSIVLLLLALMLYVRSKRAPAEREGRYVSAFMVTPNQADLLCYLQTVFPGQAVIPNVPLSKIISIRQTANRHQALLTLDTMQVNYVVCDKAGKAAFVFEVEPFHIGESSEMQLDGVGKNRIFKSAGIRLIYIKDSTLNMPSPEEFRKKLSLVAVSLPERPSEAPANSVSVLRDLDERMAVARSGIEVTEIKNSDVMEFKDSDVMGISRLMGLESDGANDNEIDPWAGVEPTPALRMFV